jgi:hypothetical protein
MDTTEFAQQAITFTMTLALALGFLYFNKAMTKKTESIIETAWVFVSFIGAALWFCIASTMLWDIQSAVF